MLWNCVKRPCTSENGDHALTVSEWFFLNLCRRLKNYCILTTTHSLKLVIFRIYQENTRIKYDQNSFEY